MKTRILGLAVLTFALWTAATQADDEIPDQLLGRWDQLNVDGYVRFRGDGTFRWGSPRNQLIEGCYRMLDGGAIEFNFYTAQGQRRTAEFKYTLKSDGLRLKINNRWVVYKKAKSMTGALGAAVPAPKEPWRCHDGEETDAQPNRSVRSNQPLPHHRKPGGSDFPNAREEEIDHQQLA
jgi:hypothetical protein